MVSLPDLWRVVVVDVFRLSVVFWGHPRVRRWSFLDDTHKFRHCTRLFTKNYSPGFYLGWVGLVGLTKGVLFPLVISLIAGVTLIKGSG